MPKRAFAGPAALLAGPLTIIACALVIPTLSDKAADQVAALDHHRTAMLTGLSLQLVTIALLVAGAIWLAFTVSSHAPRLAFAGGSLAVGGGLIVLFIDAIHVGAASAALGLGVGQATGVVDRILSSRVVTVFEPLQMLQDIGFVVLAAAVVKAGVPKWAATAVAAGAIAESLGFAAGLRGLVAIAFAVMFAGLVPTVTRLTGARPMRSAAAISPAAA